MKKNFLICGFIGWCLEILWTGLHSMLAGELTMTARTSLLMFPIYGCAAIIASCFSQTFQSVHIYSSGCIYTVGILFRGIFKWKPFASRFHMCPWDYSNSPFSYHGRDPS